MGNCCSCSCGFGLTVVNSKRKKSIVIVSSAIAQTDQHQTWGDRLPIEIWDHILQNLKNSTKDILICRLVCHDWKDLTDGLLQRELMWIPLYPFIASVPLIFMGSSVEAIIRRTRGTRFASCSRLQTFLSQMKGFDGNPFPNRTVLLYPNPDLCLPNTKPHHRLYKTVPELLTRYGEHIWALEYRVREDVSASVQHLRVICKLPNLKMLTLYTRDWNRRNVRQGLMKLNRYSQEFTMSSLSHLKIMGSNGILPLNFLFAPLQNQIQYLYFCFVDNVGRLGSSGERSHRRVAREIDPQIKQGLVYSIPDLMPNLTRLKVDEVNEELIDKILPSPLVSGKVLGGVQHLSVKLQRAFFVPLNRLLQAIDEHFRFSIKSLQLEISRWSIQESSSADSNDADEGNNLPLRDKVLKVNPKCTLLRLTDLTIPYALYVLEPQFLFQFARKCEHLRTLTFISVNIHYADFPDFDGFCKPLWTNLPLSLEKITVRYWVNSETKKRKSPKKKQGIVNGVIKTLRGRRPARRQLRKMQPEPTAKVLVCLRPTPRRHSWTAAGPETRKL